MKKDFFNLKKGRWLLFTLLAMMMGARPAWAQMSILSEGFESNSLATNGWTTSNPGGSAISTSAKKTGTYGYQFNYYSSGGPRYLISSELSIPSSASDITLSFYYKKYSNSYTEKFKVGYSTSTNELSSFTWGDEVNDATISEFKEYSNTSLPSGTKYIAIQYCSGDAYYLYIDDISLTCNITGPALTVADGATSISSGYSYNFGLATSGSTKTFTLSNPGTEAAPITIGHTGSFGVSSTSTSIPAGGNVTLTVTMPEASGSDVITISSTSTAIEDFVINVSGTIRDASKMWCNFSEGVPSTWTNSGNWNISTSGAGEGTSRAGYAYNTTYGSNKLMCSPLVTIADGEKLYLMAKGHGSTASWNVLKIQYSADGKSWTTAKDLTGITNTWQSIEVTEIPAGNWYIGFYGSYAYFTDIYGGIESTAPVIALSQSSYDFRLISASTTTPEAITITNTGKSALTGLNIISDNANFTVSVTDNATTIAANGGTATFNVTMVPNVTGIQSATITVKSDNADDLIFTVKGAVAKAGTTTIDFNDNDVPSCWTNSGWTFNNGAAYTSSYTYKLTSPKLKFVDGDFLAIKACLSSNSSSYYITIQGSSDNGATWTAYNKKLSNDVLSDDYSTIILDDVPTTVNKIQIYGNRGYIDEIAGLTYVAELSVTTGDPAAAVATPANYDFGDCKKDESVTYNFANASSVGTINITNVAITGDGAAAYSTNWTASVAAPFALTITRTYDITRTGAQDAVVTVTTSDGDFVINVTGTDWAPITAFPWTENFNGTTSGIPAGWDNSVGTTTDASYKWTSYSTGYDGRCLRFDSYSNSKGNTNFLKTPIMNLPAGKDMQLKFWYKNPTGGDFSVYISNDGGATYETALATGLTGVTDWTEKSIGIPSGYTDDVVIVFKGTSNYGSSGAYIYLDDVTVQEQEDGANFAISNNAKSTKDFGRVNPNSVQEETYTITNSGNAALEVTFTDADDFIVVKGNTEPWNDGKLIVPAKNGETDGTASFVVKMVTDGTYGDKSGDVVLNFTALNATSFTIPLKGHVIDPTVLDVDFEGGAFPAGWQVGTNWSVGSASGNHYAVQSQTSLANASAFVTTPLTFADGDKLTFMVMRNLTGSSSYKKSLKVRYSTDGGVTWSEYKDYGDEFGSSFAQYELTDVPVGTAIVEFFGNNIKIDDIQGVKNATKPAIAITEEGAAVANNGTKAFGYLNANGPATYTVKNIGNATLKADIAGDGVTVSPAKIEVAAGETADITVTMVYAEPYGERTGMKMTIDSEDDWISDFVVNFTAELVDPTAFVEDFTSGKPAGWYLDTWAVSNGEASINVGTAKAMITEKIGAEDGKNTLSFDTKLAYDYGYGTYTLSVYTSADRKNWTEAKTVTLTSDVQTVTLDALADGDYYVKFEATNAIVDNIKGVKKLDAPAHDLYLVSATLPTDEITPIDTYTATVNVASLRADETAVAVELWMKKGEEDAVKVAEKTAQSIANGATVAIQVSGNAPSAGTFDVYAKIVCPNVETIETEKVSVTVEDKTELSLTGFTAATKNVQADDDNNFTADFNVTVKNTGSTAFTASEVSVTVTDKDNNDLQTATWTPDETIYLKAGNYTADNANLAVYRWTEGENNAEWALFTGSNGIYTAELNGRAQFIICRTNPEVAVSDLAFDNGVLAQSNELTTAGGVVFENNGYQDNKLNLTQSNNFIAGMSATIKVSVTAAAGNGGTFQFNAKENVSDVYWYSGLGYLQEVTVTAAPVITLNENGDGTFATGTNRKVRLNHTFVEGWNTICLPFAINATDIHADAKALKFSAYNDGTKELTFSPVTELEANKPYVIYVPANITEAIEFTGKTVTSVADPETAINGVTFQGTYAPMAAGSLKNMWGLTAKGKIAKASASTTMKGFRAYFIDVPSDARVVFLDDETTGISTIEVENAAVLEGVYNLNGQKVEKLKKGGLYIINGKKVVKK